MAAPSLPPGPQPWHRASAAIEVFAPARLHLGFLDLHGGLGRRFGGIGLTIEEIGLRLRLVRSEPAGSATGGHARADRIVAAVADRLGIVGPIRVTVHEAIPEHVGLGSGTQLGLAIAVGLAALEGRKATAHSLARLVDRGARSGIGIGAFDQGGFLVDGGRGASDAPAPIVARAEFPPSWRVVLIFDGERRGLSGDAETAAFAALPPFPEELAARLCHVTLMRLLPGLVEADFAAVCRAIGEIQTRIGDHFAPAQGGRYASSRVAEALEWLRLAGHEGIGQSSWGPTGFVLVPDERQARALGDELATRFDGALSFHVCAGRNRGAEISIGR
jgi:beta-ribofuranosylaminobenzene 5'-phosphate synthase